MVCNLKIIDSEGTKGYGSSERNNEDNKWRLPRTVIFVVKDGIRQVKQYKQELLKC